MTTKGMVHHARLKSCWAGVAPWLLKKRPTHAIRVSPASKDTLADLAWDTLCKVAKSELVLVL